MTETGGSETVMPEPVPRTRRRWPWVLLGLVVVLAVLVLLTPTIMSLGPMRQYVVGKINHNLHGRMEIGDWSVGWNGTELRNVRVFDANQAEVLSVARLRTSLSFWDAVHGTYNLGATEVEEPNFTQLVIEADGHTNLEDLFAQSRSARRTARHAKLPFEGDFMVSRLRATVVDRRDGTTQIVEPSALTMRLKSLADPVEYNLSLNLRTPDGTKQSKHEGSAARPDELVHVSGEQWPIGPVANAGAEALLKALGRPLVANSAKAASSQPTTAASTKPVVTHRKPRPATQAR
jgi:hypothetical protein